MAVNSRQERVYGPSSISGHANVQQGDHYGHRIEHEENIHVGAAIGHNSGVVANHFYNNSSLQQPSIITPYHRNREFVERDEFIQLWNRRGEVGNRIALVGLGGVGKSHIAIEFAYRIHHEQPRVWVFWVHASNAARLEESYKTIAESLQLPRRHELHANVFFLVNSFLARRENGPWLMVVDNADDERVALGSDRKSINQNNMQGSPSLSHHLPSCAHGFLLITTRNRRVAEGLVGNDSDIIPVGVMDENSAVQLLQKKLSGSSATYATTELILLATQLDYMPLALSQAAAYIQRRAPRMSVASYLQKLVKGDDWRDRLLQTETRDPWRDGKASNSIIMTWHHSFEYIRQERVSASWLLSLMSQFGRESIPETLLVGQYIESNDFDPEEGFDEDVIVLRDLGLISINAAGDAFSMHRLVQVSTRRWLELKQETARWQQRSVEALEKHFPTDLYEDWPTSQILFPHVVAMRFCHFADTSVEETFATVLDRALWYAVTRGQYHQAENMARQNYETRMRLSGLTNMETLTSMYSLGVILHYEEKIAEAEELLLIVLPEMEKILGMYHAATLTTVDRLGLILNNQGKHEQAEAMHRRALAGFNQIRGTEHPDSLVILGNLAFGLREGGKYEQAEATGQQALEACERVLGPEHPFTLEVLHGLGTILSYQKKFREAEMMHRRALLAREKILGIDHPYTLLSMSQLGLDSGRQEKHEEAEMLLRRAVAGAEKAFGEEDPTTLRSVENLSILLREMHRDEEALQLLRRVIVGYSKILGPAHPKTIGAQRNEASLMEQIATSG